MAGIGKNAHQRRLQEKDEIKMKRHSPTMRETAQNIAHISRNPAKT